MNLDHISPDEAGQGAQQAADYLAQPLTEGVIQRVRGFWLPQLVRHIHFLEIDKQMLREASRKVEDTNGIVYKLREEVEELKRENATLTANCVRYKDALCEDRVEIKRQDRAMNVMDMITQCEQTDLIDEMKDKVAKQQQSVAVVIEIMVDALSRIATHATARPVI